MKIRGNAARGKKQNKTRLLFWDGGSHVAVAPYQSLNYFIAHCFQQTNQKCHTHSMWDISVSVSQVSNNNNEWLQLAAPALRSVVLPVLWCTVASHQDHCACLTTTSHRSVDWSIDLTAMTLLYCDKTSDRKELQHSGMRKMRISSQWCSSQNKLLQGPLVLYMQHYNCVHILQHDEQN